MTEELKTLAGKSSIKAHNLRWRDYIEFSERFGVALEDLSDPNIREKIPAAKRTEMTLWLVWKSTTGGEIPFEEWLEQEVDLEQLGEGMLF